MPAFRGSQVCCSQSPDPAVGHCQPTPLPETPGCSQASLAQFLVGSLLLSPGSWCQQVSLCPPRVCFPVLWKFCNQIPLAFKVKFPGGFQFLCEIHRLGNLLWVLELLQQRRNFFGIIVLQFVGCPLGSSLVGLMPTSSKRTYATCCSRNPCLRGKPLLTHASVGDTHTLKGRSTVSSGGHWSFPWAPGVHKVLFAPSKHLWQVQGLILNTIVPLLLSYWCFLFALGCGASKTRLEADCGSDHELLIAKFSLKMKKVGKITRPFRYDLNQIPYDYPVEVTYS